MGSTMYGNAFDYTFVLNCMNLYQQIPLGKSLMLVSHKQLVYQQPFDWFHFVF